MGYRRIHKYTFEAISIGRFLASRGRLEGYNGNGQDTNLLNPLPQAPFGSSASFTLDLVSAEESVD